MQRALEILNTVFGYDDFRHSQADIINSLLKGNDALALMPTGGGKSLCYQIPALILEGVAIVVSPLIALMQDQVDALSQLGIQAAYLNSTLEGREVFEIEQKLLKQEYDLLYIAPERLLNQRTMGLLQQINIALFAIDEAHCVSQWGHDFRPEYQQLKALHEAYPSVPRIALTATADQRTRTEIIQQLSLQQADIYISSFDRPNIRYAIQEGSQAKQQLWRFISTEHAADSGIVYCLSRKKVEETAQWLNEQGRNALPYHAGLNAATRQQHQQRFLREDNIIIVATIAFGMGIDKPDVRFVAHLSLPKSIEAYYQETGRAGRDGQAANAWMCFGLQDIITLRQFVHNSEATPQQKAIENQKLEALLGLCETTHCRRHTLLNYFDEAGATTCNNCDNCLTPPETYDASDHARKALSCVYRSGQQFGVTYLINILLGKQDQRILDNRHNQLSTFAIGTDLSAAEWRSIFRQLIARSYLYVDLERFGALSLTERCRPVLRSETQILLRKHVAKPASNKAESSKRKSDAIRPQDMPLWQALRACRKQLADDAGVPPYVIFHDSTLIEMSYKRPQSAEEMRYITGVGEQKMSRYGQTFIDIIQQNPLSQLLNNQLSETINQTLVLLEQGIDIAQIATQRELKVSTIEAHLAEAISTGLLTLEQVTTISTEEIDQITAIIESLPEEDKLRLKPVYDAFNEQYSYGILRCVQAHLGISVE